YHGTVINSCLYLLVSFSIRTGWSGVAFPPVRNIVNIKVVSGCSFTDSLDQVNAARAAQISVSLYFLERRIVDDLNAGEALHCCLVEIIEEVVLYFCFPLIT